MSETSASELSERQDGAARHDRERARRFEEWTHQEVGLDILDAHRRRWWDPDWHAYTLVLAMAPAGCRALVVGCGFGDDAIRLRKLGLRVSAFDPCAESLDIAAIRAARSGVRGRIEFRCQPCEKLDYQSGTFDLVLAVDILHQVDVPLALAELRRVAAPGGVLVCNEPYAHTALTRVRESRLLRRRIYPRVARWMHVACEASELDATGDERTLDQRDVTLLRRALLAARVDYFNMLAGRLVPERFARAARADRVGLRALGPLAASLAGRIVVSGRFPAEVRAAEPVRSTGVVDAATTRAA